MSAAAPLYPVACMDCGEPYRFAEAEHSTGLCAPCLEARLNRPDEDEEEAAA